MIFLRFPILIRYSHRQFEKDVKEKLGVVASKTICPIKRGGPLDRFRYLTSSGSFTLITTLLDIYQEFVIIRWKTAGVWCWPCCCWCPFTISAHSNPSHHQLWQSFSAWWSSELVQLPILDTKWKMQLFLLFRFGWKWPSLHWNIDSKGKDWLHWKRCVDIRCWRWSFAMGIA